MKIRCDFVTNSSSSNMILAVKGNISMESIYQTLLDMKNRKLESFVLLPHFDNLKEFALRLAGLAAGKDLANFFKWVEEMGYRHPKIVKNNRQWLHKDNLGEFPTYAINLQKAGYEVCMRDINSFSDDDNDIMNILSIWGGHIHTDDFVLQVESYY